MDDFKDAAKRFQNDTAKHEMTVLHDDGLYRHIQFMAPDRSAYWFNLITWPSVLTISGDMGCYVFARQQDMFAFFRHDIGINPSYWAEKIRAAGRDGVKTYSEERFREHVAVYVAEWGDDPALNRAVRDQILDNEDIHHEEGARAALNAFDYADFRFHDTWEWDLSDYTAQFLWCCHAIRWGIAQHDAKRADAEAVAP